MFWNCSRFSTKKSFASPALSDEKSKGIIEYLLRETNLSIEDIIKVSNEEKELLGGKKLKNLEKMKLLSK